jgi:opacity protein-like surface antigen
MRKTLVFVAVIVIVAAAVQPAAAQQISFQKWDMYAGYSYLNTPTNNLTQHGFNTSFGRNLNKWVALGMDFSHFNGSGPQVASGTELAARLPANLLVGIPPSIISGVRLNVPINASTTTFAAGTQFQVRKNKWVTPFFRPFLGAFHGSANGKPSQITAAVLPAGVPPALFAGLLASIPPDVLKKAVTQSDTSLGYGVGGGFDINVSKPVGIRFAADYIRTSLFDKKQNNIRIATGLIYRFGGEVKSK